MGLRQIAEAVNLKNKHPLPEPNEDCNFPFFSVKKDFESFLEKLHIEKGGFLMKTDEDFYSLCFVSGVDITTFHRCIIPTNMIEDFQLTENKWNFLSNENLSSLKNLFSSQEYISITDIILFPIEKNKTYLFLIKSQKDIYRNDFNVEAADKSLKDFLPQYEKYKSIIEITRPVYSFQHGKNAIMLKIKSALNLNNIAHLLRISFENIFPDTVQLQTNLNSLSLYYSIINKILSLIGKSNISMLGMDNILYASIFSAQNLQIELYTKRIMTSLNKIYGEAICAKLLIKHTGNSKTVNEINDFFMVGIDDKTG